MFILISVRSAFYVLDYRKALSIMQNYHIIKLCLMDLVLRVASICNQKKLEDKICNSLKLFSSDVIRILAKINENELIRPTDATQISPSIGNQRIYIQTTHAYITCKVNSRRFVFAVYIVILFVCINSAVTTLFVPFDVFRELTSP